MLCMRLLYDILYRKQGQFSDIAFSRSCLKIINSCLPFFVYIHCCGDEHKAIWHSSRFGAKNCPEQTRGHMGNCRS